MKYRVLVITIITLVMLEVGSFLLFRQITGVDFSYSDMQQRRARRIAELQTAVGDQDSAGALHDHHPYLGYTGHPAGHPWGTDNLPFNEYGMISRHTYPYRKTGNEYVVAVLGGSVAEIFSSLAEEAMDMHLKKHHGFEKNIVLLSLATGGFKQPQQLIHLEFALLSGFDIDAVINIDGYNDLVMAVENLENRINPIFPSGKHIGVIARSKLSSNLDPEFIDSMAAYYDLKETERGLLSFINRPVPGASVFMNLLGEVMSKRSRRSINRAMTRMILESESGMKQEFRGPPFHSGTGNAEVAASIWARSSEMLYRICKAYGIIYLHILQPNQYVEGSKQLTRHEKAHAYLPDSRRANIVRSGYPELQAKGSELSDRGVPFQDLTGIFSNYKGDVYSDSCCHINRAGNVILGKRIADLLAMEMINQHSPAAGVTRSQ